MSFAKAYHPRVDAQARNGASDERKLYVLRGDPGRPVEIRKSLEHSVGQDEIEPVCKEHHLCRVSRSDEGYGDTMREKMKRLTRKKLRREIFQPFAEGFLSL